MFKLTIDTYCAAFDGEDKPHEIARILREAANKIEMGHTEFVLQDINGNSVGKAKLN